MNFDWFNIFNLDDFLSLGLVSINLTVLLESYGEKEILVTKGNEVSVVYDDVVMPISYLDDNPFVREGETNTYAVYKDSENNIWLGIEVPA